MDLLQVKIIVNPLSFLIQDLIPASFKLYLKNIFLIVNFNSKLSDLSPPNYVSYFNGPWVSLS